MNRPAPIPLRPDRYAFEHEQRRSLVRAIAAQVFAEMGQGRSASAILQRAWPSDARAALLLRAKWAKADIDQVAVTNRAL
jgi:hypothetical protein